MSSFDNRPSVSAANLDSSFRTTILAFFTATVSYLAAKLGGALIINIPQAVWPLWPGCAVLVAILLLVPRKIWPVLLPAGLAGFVLYDLEAGVSIPRIAWLILADTLEVLIAAWGLSHSLDGLPRLNSLKALAKYLFFAVFLAPLIVSSIGIHGLHGGSWLSWKFSFLSEALAFLTVTPAILGLFGRGWPPLQSSRAQYVEAVALVTALASLSYFMFAAPGWSAPPALLYSLVPFLIWSALRFGSTGVGASASIVALMSIWGAVHGHGPFTETDPIDRVLFLQLFLLFASMPFMVLAVLVEDRKCAQDELHTSEERLRLAMEAAKLGAWEWDVKSGRTLWFGEAYTLVGMTPAEFSRSVQDFWDRVHPEHAQQLENAIEVARQNHAEFDQEFRVVWPDGTLHWLRSVGRFFYRTDGQPQRMLGISVDITLRKQAQESLRQKEADLTEAQRLAQVGSWGWDPKTDTVTWSEELYRIAGMDPSMPAVSYKDHSKLYTAESWERLRPAVEDALRTGRPYELDLQMIRVDGARRWLIAHGEAHRDASGAVVQLRGTVQDITGRKRIEEALRESEERLRLAIQAGKMFAYEWDATTDVVVRSPESAQILGIDEGTPLTGQQVLANVHADDRERLKAAITALTTETPYLEISYRIVRPDSTLIWVERNSRAHFDDQGRMLRIVGMVADVTERKKAEQALREGEERLHLAIQAGGMYAYEWDPLTDRVIRSAECVDILGKDEPLQITRRELTTRVHPDDREQFAANRSQPTSEHPNSQMTYRVLRHDGSVVWLEKRARAFFDDQGRMLRTIGVVADITARKHAEQALAQSQEKFSKAFRQIPMLLTLSNAKDHRYIEVNETFERITGWHRDEVIGRTAFDLGLWADPAQRVDVIKRLLAEGNLRDLEARFCMRDGSIRIGNVSAEVIELDGQSCVLGVIADVTERKNTEEALRESETRFELVANTAPVLIWMSDTNKLCTYFNKPWLDFTGRSIESEIGNGWTEGVHLEDFKACLETYVKAFDRREKFSMEYRLHRYDGEYRWVLDIGVPRFNQDGSFAGYIGSCVDVTDRRATEHALRESEDKLRLLLDSTAEAIYGIDLEGRCTFCNPACLRALGYERNDELLGRDMHDLIHHSRADGMVFPAGECRIMRALQTGQGVHVDDEVLWAANGTSFPAEYWSYPQRKGQEVVGAVVTFLDTTKRKRTEAALENLSRRLISAQEQERTRIARELHDDIGQRIALLTVELGQLPQYSPHLPAEIGARIDELRRQSSEIAADVQALSHELHSSKLEYLGIVTAMRGFCKEFSAQQNVEVIFAHDAIPGMVPSDISLCLYRVLQEALHNALKYSGVRHFDAELRASPDAIDLTVRDSGPGFDVEEAMKTSGLGLVSMGERIKLVGGQLSIESHPGCGTTIHARVPFREAARAAT